MSDISGAWNASHSAAAKRKETVDQLRARIAALEAENARLQARLDLDDSDFPLTACHASLGDGECVWTDCPQAKRYEGHCPLDLVYIDPRVHGRVTVTVTALAGPEGGTNG